MTGEGADDAGGQRIGNGGHHVTAGDTGAQRTDRQLGWLISLCGVVLVAGQTGPLFLSQSPHYPTWWNIGGMLVVVIVAALAVLGRVLPFQLLRIGWIGAPALGWTLQLTSFLDYHGPRPDATLPWAATIQPVLVSYLVLWMRPAAAVTLAVLSGFLPALSALAAFGYVPAAVASMTPIHISNIGFVAIFVGIRARVTRLRAAESRAHEQDRRSARAVAEARRQDQLGRLIHDEVLSVLTAAMSFSGEPPAQLRAEATRALLLLDAPAPGQPAGQRAGPAEGMTSTHDALAAITATLRRIDPACPVHADATPGAVPRRAVEAITHAAAEALRNSTRHAGVQCPRTIEVRVAPGEISATVRDDGPGFDLRAVDPMRLGVRDSILARMTALDGGDVRIRTLPGHGTEVTLTWRT